MLAKAGRNRLRDLQRRGCPAGKGTLGYLKLNHRVGGVLGHWPHCLYLTWSSCSANHVGPVPPAAREQESRVCHHAGGRQGAKPLSSLSWLKTRKATEAFTVCGVPEGASSPGKAHWGSRECYNFMKKAALGLAHRSGSSEPGPGGGWEGRFPAQAGQAPATDCTRRSCEVPICTQKQRRLLPPPAVLRVVDRAVRTGAPHEALEPAA